MSKIVKIKKALKSKEKNHVVPPEDWLSTGSAILNLACSGRGKGGIAKEDYVLIVGESSAGKTWLALTILAEAAYNSNFKDYQLIYDSAENGAKMNVGQFWGKLANRMAPPRGTPADPEYSDTVEEFYFNLDDTLKKGPCIYVLDSMDALDSVADEELFEKVKKAYRARKELPESYGVAKAKENAKNLRRIPRKIRKNKSIVIIIAQAKEKIGGFITGQKTRSGGKAMKFFAHTELWLSVKKDITKDAGFGSKKTKETQGIIARIKVEKSRHTGQERAVNVPIYWSYGIDDVGACVDYLVDKGYWSKSNGVINAKELKLRGKREELVAKIEEKNKQEELYSVVRTAWKEINRQLSIRRKKRYD